MNRVENTISQVLVIGVLVSFTLIVLGSVISLWNGPAQPVSYLISPAATFPRTWAWFGHGLAHFQGETITVLGLLLLIATPVIRVAISIAAFAREHDRTYVIITTVVFLLILASFALGKG